MFYNFIFIGHMFFNLLIFIYLRKDISKMDLLVQIQFYRKGISIQNQQADLIYREHFANIKKLIQVQMKSADKIRIIQKSPPYHYQPVFHDKNHTEYYNSKKQKVIYPRLGSFEIYVDKMLLFSKLRCNRMPDVEALSRLIYKIYEQKTNGKQVYLYAYEYWKDLGINKNEIAQLKESQQNINQTNLQINSQLTNQLLSIDNLILANKQLNVKLALCQDRIHLLNAANQEMKIMNQRYLREYQGLYLDYVAMANKEKKKYQILSEENHIIQTALKYSKAKLKQALAQSQTRKQIDNLLKQNQERMFKISILQSSLNNAEFEIQQLKNTVQKYKNQITNPQSKLINNSSIFARSKDEMLSKTNEWMSKLAKCQQNLQLLVDYYRRQITSLNNKIMIYEAQDKKNKVVLKKLEDQLKTLRQNNLLYHKGI